MIESTAERSGTLRIGQIVPSSNTTMETEIPAMLHRREQHFPERFSFHSSRMRMRRVSPEELRTMNQEGLRCAAELADARVDVMSTACLVAIMAQGAGYHREVEEQFRRVVLDNGAQSKVMTSAGALLYGLKTLGARKISLLAPYVKQLTDKVVEYIESEGIEVVDRISFAIEDNVAVGRRNPLQLLEDVKRLNTADVDVVVLSACVQMRSLEAVEPAEKMLGLPVVSTAVCTARNMLDLLQLEPAIPGFGTLLDRARIPDAAAGRARRVSGVVT